MNNKLIDTANEKVLRGLVLEILSKAKPTGATMELVQAALRPYSYSLSKEDALNICLYLEGKKLVTLDHVSNERLNIRRSIAHLTSKGIDVLDGTETVSGVELAGD